MAIKFDKIGYWSEVKLEIIHRYAAEYSKILSKDGRFSHRYIDAFAGFGKHKRKEDGTEVPGSPLVALNVEPPFREYWFIDLEEEKLEFLQDQVGDRPDVRYRKGDCNQILLDEVFPTLRYEDYRRALLLLDPYGLHLDWTVIKAAADLKTTEIFLNFPIMDMNRNVFWNNPELVDPRDVERMTLFWGDESWRDVAYTTEWTLFGDEQKKADNQAVADGFRSRLRDVAGFKYVPPPIPMRNDQGAIVYYLFFASHKAVAEKIITHIFDKFRDRGRM